MDADRSAAVALCSGGADCFCAVCRGDVGPGLSSLDSSSEISRHDTLTLYCAKCGHKHVVKLRCGDRTCAVCREKDFWRMFKGYLESIEAIKRPKLLTLTRRNVATLTREYIRGLRKFVTKLFHRKWYRERIRGGLQTIEIVNKGRGWHVHMHVLLDADYLPQKKIEKDWREITGDSFMVDIREAGTVKEGLKYCLKYLSKPPTLWGKDEEISEEEKEQRCETYREVVKGVRLVQPFGSLYGDLVMSLPEVICPECGGHEWITWGFDLKPEFYRFLKEKGG